MNKEAVEFIFDSYNFSPENMRADFNYIVRFVDGESLNFTEKIVFTQKINLNNISKKLIEKMLLNLHLILGVSYYKLYCPPKIKVCNPLTKKEADFWNIIYKKGLGEFFYRNKLDPKIFPEFPFLKQKAEGPIRINRNLKHLLFFGGGKDSIVAAELLKSQKIDVDLFVSETQRSFENINRVANISELKLFKIKRFIDEKIFIDDYKKYDGHIPISAVYAFLGLFWAVLYNYSYLVVANEYSSNFGNIKYKGENINHQWSKSIEFETIFNEYVKNFITPDILYFSLLRPFYEIRIAEMFSKYGKYFNVFSSCNKNFKIVDSKCKLWCGECAKCVFTFIILSAFLPKKTLISIFKKNLYADESLLPLFRDVLGFGKIKPFDCVGTFKESRVAFLLASKRFKNDLIIKAFYSSIKDREELKDDVFEAKETSNIPDYLRFLGMKNVAILGYGKEGEITHKYLRKNFPDLKVIILDEKINKDYLDKQDNFDIAVKTPGIPNRMVKIPYTTATNIFFSKIKNKIIGVSGSKGKSTTASLIYNILKESGKDVVLAGNIGKPMLEILLKPVNNKDTIFVLELSSYQLEDIRFSPNIAVLTSLFPEHMDYHLGIDKYYAAKKNIINFQTEGDIFIYNPRDKKVTAWLKGIKSELVPFVSKIPFDLDGINLIGGHNKENIRAATTVAKILGISNSTIKKAVKKFKGLPHRLEFVGEFKGVRFYDDAISTTPESTIEAIKSLPSVETLLLGGEDRGYDFSNLGKTIQKYSIKNIVLFPESGKRIFNYIKKLNILKTQNMEDAVKFAYKNTAKGKICLLSCASPSYSLWKNFEEKGDLFQYFVRKYSK